ncbi:transglutaminase [Fluoribacter dumoffii]|uniref:transglutaminase n=1 Tax=Fluoribacter dumoffii TaxID=463 RepID=UPI00026C7BFF|nr:transglutaminase [Fluoribacter dumoffii]MCW8386286.1 transglutaminase [Fluoribacter dumoffii]MCW8419339.1 transglutaminase [Fluoribacter dumoffii]MCW8452786.1 transglutaminase [Fluoribacter dumoffii]MCW8459964.1 transglutaminase [Fluoribacter dumoffii]MCW8483442.1 transglutaminase [Fluoribacter dumoffii]
MLLFLSYKNQKNVQITKESDCTSFKTIRDFNEYRFDILINHPKTVVFKDLDELLEDLKRFQIVQTYEKELQGTRYISQLHTINLVRFLTSADEMAIELEIRKKAMASLKEESDPLKKEIISKLIDSLHFFKSYERFTMEVLFRHNAVKLMDMDKFHLADDKYRYPTQEENYLQLDPHYWRMAENHVGFFIPRKGVRPSAAINSIFEGGNLVVLECHSWMLCVQYKALLDTIGADHFNFLFKTKPLVITDGLNLNETLAADLGEILPCKWQMTKEKLIPGDWVYLYNFPDYKEATLYDASKNGAGLHSLVMGSDKYRGFGSSKAMTENEMKYEFLSIYNEDFLAEPLVLDEGSIDSKTMGLDVDEKDLRVGDVVVIYGHIDCPDFEWRNVNCTYLGQGKYRCEQLKKDNATENEIVLALLEKYNASLPQRKTAGDLAELNLFKSLLTNVRGIDFSQPRFNFLFEKQLSLYAPNSPCLFVSSASSPLQSDLLPKASHLKK